MATILAVDIGGTNSRFAWFEAGSAQDITLKDKIWLKSWDAKTFPEVVEMLDASAFSVMPRDADITVVAVCAAVEKRRLAEHPVNIPWSVDLRNSAQDFGAEQMLMINDFVAQGYACVSPIAKEARRILPGDVHPEGTIAVLGAGTGLGTGAIVPLPGGGYSALPSEGGHMMFSFVGDEEFEFARFAVKESGCEQIIFEEVIAARGLTYIHKFHTGRDLSPPEVTATFAEDKNSPTLAWAARFYGRGCRDLALMTVATGGLYLAGGVIAKAPELVTHPAFEEEFRFSETHAPLMAEIPVFLNSNEDAGLWGAAMYGALELFGK